MKVRLTERSIASLQARAGRVYAWDTELPGFGFIRYPSGNGTFVAQYRVPGGGRRGKSHRLTIGHFPALKVEQARREARRLLGRVATGSHPAVERGEWRRAPTVAEAAPAFLALVAAKRKATTHREYARQFDRYIAPAIGSTRVTDVRRAQLSALHFAMRSTPYMANRVIALLASYFHWAIRQGIRASADNPATGIELFAESSRERFLTAAEMTALGKSLVQAERVGLAPAPQHRRRSLHPNAARHTAPNARDVQPANPVAVNAIRFLLLTGWREGEVLGLRWDSVDFERQFATLPQTKSGRSQRPLGRPALALLEALDRRRGSPFVFPGARDGQPLKDVKRVWYAVRHAAGLDSVRLHDLRHSFASVSASQGNSLYVTGALLGHSRAETTRRYAHLSEDARLVAADRAAAEIAARLTGSATMVRKLRTR